MNELTLERRSGTPALDQIHVSQAMHPGLITCSLETPLPRVAELMAAYHVHAVVALGEGEHETPMWVVVSDLDLARAAIAADFGERTAGAIASTPPIAVSEHATVSEAVELMARHGVTHVIVVGHASDRPVGVLSTLDVARTVGSRPHRRTLARNVVTRTLTNAHVEYDLLRHRETMTARDEAAVLGVRPEEVAKTIVLRTGEGYARAVLPASERIDLRKLHDRLGDDVRLATEEELVWAYPQFELGAVPPFGGPSGDRILVDPRLAGCERLVFEAGVHDESVRVRTEDLLLLAEAEFAEMCDDRGTGRAKGPATKPVRFELTRECDGKELLEFLRDRGFAATLAQHGDRFDVDVTSPTTDAVRLRADAWSAVARWLAEREPTLVPTPVGEDVVVFSPPAG